MTALSAATERLVRNTKGQVVHEYVVGTGATIYQGALVTFNVAGVRIIAGAAAAANGDFVGMAIETKTGVTAATVYCKVVSEIEAKFAVHAATALTSADLGGLVAMKDDNTITTASDAGTAAKQHLVGVATESAASLSWWVFLTRSGTAANATT